MCVYLLAELIYTISDIQLCVDLNTICLETVFFLSLTPIYKVGQNLSACYFVFVLCFQAFTVCKHDSAGLHTERSETKRIVSLTTKFLCLFRFHLPGKRFRFLNLEVDVSIWCVYYNIKPLKLGPVFIVC